jgi:hypothetical protein
MEKDPTIALACQAECRDYRAMLELVDQQRLCIDGQDLDGFQQTLTQVRLLMERIELRQVQIPGFRQARKSGHGGIEEYLEEARGLIRRIDSVRGVNEEALKHWRDRTKAQLGQANGPGRVGRGYGKRAAVGGGVAGGRN